MIEASDDATWDKENGMALNDAMYMCNIVARRAVWQPTLSPRQKHLFVFFTSQVSFLHLPKKNLRLGAVNLQLLGYFFYIILT